MFGTANTRNRAPVFCAVIVGILGAGGHTQADGPDVAHLDVSIMAEPYVELEILSDDVLSLTIPPPGSTDPLNTGVKFRVLGNAGASVTATPDDFIDIPGVSIMGRAALDGNSSEDLGYRLQVRFPSAGQGPDEQVAGLPGNAESGTLPLEGDLISAGGSLDGVVDLIASHEYTTDDEFPLPGMYSGTVTLTVTPQNL